MATHPSASLPEQAQSWGDLKAAYRLLHEDDVTHAALSAPHWRVTREMAEGAEGPVLFLQDGSHLDFSSRAAQGLGNIGNEDGRGNLLHSTLALLPGESARLLGLAHQTAWVRDGPPHRHRETRSERYRRAPRVGPLVWRARGHRAGSGQRLLGECG